MEKMIRKTKKTRKIKQIIKLRDYKLSQMLSNKKLIIFDIDDTLIKSCPAIIQHHMDIAKKMRLRVPEKKEINYLISHPWSEILKKLWPELNNAKKLAQFKKVYRSFPKKLPITLIPGAVETLNALKRRYLLGIITGRDEYSMTQLLPKLGIDLKMFSIICHGDDKITKPNPKVFEFALKRINERLRKNMKNNKLINNHGNVIKKFSKIKVLSKKDIVYVGDTLIDVNCAKKTKVDFIAVTTGHFKEKDFKKYGVLTIKSVKKLSV